MFQKSCSALLFAFGPLLNEGIMCSRVHWKFAAVIMKEPRSCSFAQDYTINSSPRPRVITVVNATRLQPTSWMWNVSFLLLNAHSKCLSCPISAANTFPHPTESRFHLLSQKWLPATKGLKKEKQRKDPHTDYQFAFKHKTKMFILFYFKRRPFWFLFFIFDRQRFSTVTTQRSCTMTGRNKPEGRLMPWILTWLSVEVRLVICISPSRHSHAGPAPLCTWWNSSRPSCPDNWSLDYRLWEYGEGKKTKRKGVIV